MKSLKYLLCLVVFTACNENNNVSDENKKTKIVAYIYADPAFVNISQELSDVYESINDSVDFQVVSLGEELAIKQMVNDSIALAVVSRPLSSAEAEQLSISQKTGKEYLFAQDAITFVANRSDRDTVFTKEQLIEALTKNPKGQKVVFDENYSSSVNYVSRLLGKEPLTTNSFATKDTKELLSYVSQNKNTIGILGSNVFSNLDDSTITALFKNIRLIGIKAKDQIYYPFQADIAAQKYPFARNIYILNSEHYYGKYSGFKNFVIGPKGQRIILKSGLMPINMPSRLLNFVKRHGS
jgi:phosphate transport system substrate-binding protein